MDPVTAIGLIASVASLVQASNSVVNVIKDFKAGDSDLVTLSNDLGAFAEALVCFERVLRSRHSLHRISGPVIEGVLQHSTRLVKELETILNQISSSSITTLRRAKWVQQKSKISKLHGQLKEQNAMLNTFLSITHAYVSGIQQSPKYHLTNLLHSEAFMTIANHYPRFMLPEADAKVETIEQSEETGSSRLQVPRPIKEMRRYSTSSIQTAGSVSDSTGSELDQLSLMSSALSLDTVTSWGSQAPNVNPDEASDLGKTPSRCDEASIKHTDREKRFIPRDIMVIRQSCRYNCYCQCHKEPPRKAKRRFGSLKHRKPQCTEPTCQNNMIADDQILGQTNSFRRALSQVMWLKSIKVRYDLKSFRTVPEGSDAMRHVKHGNLEKLKTCIESGEATIWDTAPDGWSLLHVLNLKYYALIH